MNLELATDQNFCEDDYLIANPDVRAAVERAGFTSGRQHFELRGYREGRRQRAPLIFFVHIPKTAGSTVNSHLMELFPDGSAHCEGWFFDDASMHLLDTLSWVSGHIAYPRANSRVPQFTSRRVEYFACIRNPTDRVRSHYNWLIEVFHREDVWYDGLPDWVKGMSEQIRKSGFSIPAIQANLLENMGHFLNCQTLFVAKADEPVASALDSFKFITTTDRLTDLLYAMTGEKISQARRENESFRHFDPELFYRPEMESFLREHNARDEQLFGLVRSGKLCNPPVVSTPQPKRWRARARALAARTRRLTATFRRRSRDRCFSAQRNPMDPVTLIRKLKASMFPKLVLDRTFLDKQIAELTKAVSDLTAQNQALASPPPGTFRFKGYDIPVDLMLMTGGGPDTFEEISSMHQKNLAKWIGIEPHHNVLEIGCGIGRDAIPLSTVLTQGSYVGVDIIGRSIEWCTANIGARNPNFKFIHYNIDDQLHNPDGTSHTADIVLPVDDRSVDRIFLFSVFTHMYEKDIEHYLREFRRVLKPDGFVYATTFIYDDAILESARRTNRTIFNLRFEHELYEGCRINSLEYPLGAVAFKKERWKKMLAAGGMKRAKPILNGQWSGFYDKSDDGQDALILKPA